MAQSIDIDLLRQVTIDSIRVYDAVRRAQAFTAESQHVVTIAEELLRRAGLAYLLESPRNKAARSNGPTGSPKEMVSAYILIQQSYADLKDALYRLAKAHIEAKAWESTVAIMETLLKIDPEYRDVTTGLQQILLAQAQNLFEQGKWDKGYALLKQSLPGAKERVPYFLNFLLQNDFWSGDPLQTLQREDPIVISLETYSHLPSYVQYWIENWNSNWNSKVSVNTILNQLIQEFYRKFNKLS